ncbi:MAG: CotH kinase family protein [Bacteroidales bacterium]|nr:CotH kinase family protein [Bacteroidales bacterium]
MTVLFFHVQIALPQDDSIIFSHPAGFYSASFTLSLTSSNGAASILYTIDGSNPQTSSTAVQGGTQANISVNPASMGNRPKTPAFLVRASLKWAGDSVSFPVTHTYIFLDQVKAQKHPGGDWPTYNVNGQILDFEMDPDVVNSGLYSGEIDEALLDIPSVSVVTDLASLFDPSTGIYVNAYGHGFEWERFCSVELINPDGSPGFSTNAGLRIRGGWSRHNDYPKHAFRLFFRAEYGAAKLEYPLFGDEGVSQFDKIDLRCEQNYSWANYDREHNTFVREVFSRDTQRDMGQPYTRSRYYHLYLNGMYWGIFQTQERSEARYAADYFGDSSTDYDVVKVNTEDYNYRIEATDGTLAGWGTVYNLCNAGFSSNASYFGLMGKDAWGNSMKDSEVLVNIDNLIDYMLTIFYTGNFDAPTSSFGGNTGPNNFYIIDNRNDKSKGFIFFNHDAEHALMVEPVGPGYGLEENRVSLNMNVSSFSAFHPQWLHHKLTANAEYRMHFADRVALHMTGNGALTPSRCLERFNKRVDEVEMAVIAESARWGDARTSVPYTKDATWLPEIETVQYEFFPYRTGIVLDQLKQANLYPSLRPPTISHSGSEILEAHYYAGTSSVLTINNPNSSGDVYYTIDGSDPRLIGGEIRNSAIRLDGGNAITITSPVVLSARVFNGTSWSAKRQIKIFSDNNDLSQFKVTELHYHPEDIINGTDTVSGQYYEFIEFKNTGEAIIDLSGLVLDSAVYYEFPAGYLLTPGHFFVIATKPSYFYDKYGKVATGNCKNFFDNAGEYVLLHDKQGNKVLHFLYDDALPFPVEADGEGYSLTASEINPTRDPNDYLYWKASERIDGSPFADDHSLVGIEPLTTIMDDFRLYPNPSSRFMVVECNQKNISERNHLTIAGLTGSMVYEQWFADKLLLDLSEILPGAGLYLVIVKNVSGTQTGKIVFAQ